jgi:periplasmic mercuric ion binding protein
MRRVTLASLPLFGMLLATGVAFAAPPHTVTLAVENMTCGTCPIVVKKALERVPGVSSTSVDFDKKTATVTTSAPIANRCLSRRRATAACFVPTDR